MDRRKRQRIQAEVEKKMRAGMPKPPRNRNLVFLGRLLFVAAPLYILTAVAAFFWFTADHWTPYLFNAATDPGLQKVASRQGSGPDPCKDVAVIDDWELRWKCDGKLWMINVYYFDDPSKNQTIHHGGLSKKIATGLEQWKLDHPPMASTGRQRIPKGGRVYISMKTDAGWKIEFWQPTLVQEKPTKQEIQEAEENESPVLD